MKLVETRWQQPPEGSGLKPVKAYHTYYSAFHINTSCSVFEMSDVIAAAVLADHTLIRGDGGVRGIGRVLG